MAHWGKKRASTYFFAILKPKRGVYNWNYH